MIISAVFTHTWMTSSTGDLYPFWLIDWLIDWLTCSIFEWVVSAWVSLFYAALGIENPSLSGLCLPWVSLFCGILGIENPSLSGLCLPWVSLFWRFTVHIRISLISLQPQRTAGLQGVYKQGHSLVKVKRPVHLWFSSIKVDTHLLALCQRSVQASVSSQVSEVFLSIK